MWPNEPWQQMTVVVWGVLIVAAIPLAVLIPFRKRAGKPINPNISCFLTNCI